MKKIPLFSILLLIAGYVHSQTVTNRAFYDVPTRVTKKSTQLDSTMSTMLPESISGGNTPEPEAPVNKGFGFGFSLGYNFMFDNLYDVSVSPIDNTLQVSSIPKSSFLLSTTVSAPLIRMGKGKNNTENVPDRSRKMYQKEVDGKPIGPKYYIPYGIYLVATVNLLNFSEAAGGSIFNKKIDGGLGLGYRINDDVLIAVTYEMISVRQPRDFLIEDFKNQPIMIEGEPITALDKDDENYFVDKYLPSVSLKLVYHIRGNNVKEN